MTAFLASFCTIDGNYNHMKINFEKVRENKNGWWIALDALMLLLIVVNLSWMIFDFSFTAKFFQNPLKNTSPSFYYYYKETIHPDFLFYDFFFVVFFLLEFCFRWIISSIKKEFDSWVAFPFVYWYDLMGCIPFGTFRFLRLFRIISLIVRLQKRQIIDISDSWWYKGFNRYFQIFVEEVSDRVVVNVLNGVQKEMLYGDETIKRVVNEAIIPNQERFSEWIASRVQFAIGETYKQHREDFKTYVDQTVQEAVDNNVELQRLEMIPIFGKQISNALSSSIADISFSVIERMMKDLSDIKSQSVVYQAVDIGAKTALYTSSDAEVERISVDVVSQTIEVLKEQVNKKHYNR